MVETKWADDADPEPHQVRRHGWWRLRGMDVYVVRSRDAVDKFMNLMKQQGRW